MGKFSLLKFAVNPREVVAGVRRLGGKGAVMHGVRRMSATMGQALLGPAQLRINPMGAVCNHACGMCWLQHLPPGVKEIEFRKDRATSLTLDEYRALFDGMPPGLTEVNIVGGGEPLVHPQCIDIMREVKRRKLRGYLISNGTLMREKESRAMVEMGWDLTRLSVHAGDAATFRAIHGVDHFERLRDNLRIFDRLRRAAGRERSVAMHVHNVIQRENLDAIPQMFEFAREVGADNMVFEIVFALSPDIRLTRDECGQAAEALSSNAAAAATPSNALQIAAELLRDQAGAPRERLARPPAAEPAAAAVTDEPPAAEPTPAAVTDEPTIWPMAPGPAPNDPPAEPPPPAEPENGEPPYRPANRCSVGFDSAMVTAQGQVVPCCFSTEVMGCVRKNTFRDIWYGKTYVDFRQRLIKGQFPGYCSTVRCKLKSFLHD